MSVSITEEHYQNSTASAAFASATAKTQAKSNTAEKKPAAEEAYSYEPTPAGCDAKTVSSKAQAYDKAAVKKAVQASMADVQQRLANMVSQVLGGQARASMFGSSGAVNFESDAFQEFKSGVLSGSITVDASTKSQAQALISDGGAFSVEAVTNRTMSMVQALSGGDKDKLETLKNAVIKGFEQAERIWGGKMPEITQKTYDATMARFDQWEKTGSIPLTAADMTSGDAE